MRKSYLSFYSIKIVKTKTNLLPSKDQSMENQSQAPINQIRQKINDAKSTLILLPQQHSVDRIAAGLTLYLSLQQLKDKDNQPKDVSIVTANELTVAYQRLYGVGDIQTQLGSKNLVITLNTDYDNIEKVTYDNDNGKFNLVVETKEGTNKLTKDEVVFSHRGLNADLIISVGLVSQEDAGNLLLKEPNLFSERENITLSNHPNSLSFGTVNFHEPSSSSLCEMVAKIIRNAHLPINEDIATNVIAGIESSTNNFSIKTTADTFAAISYAMRQGGKRFHLGQMGNQYGSPFTGNKLPPQMPPVLSPQDQPQTSSDQKDWYEPKIFRGTDKV
jgi:nanoRNase/pAp phosphatase (c-di-AMP/oligoRNAs hydrolase)